MNVDPEVTVVVVNWNGGDLLRRCVASVRASAAVGTRLQLVVVDNGSTDGSVELASAEVPGLETVNLPENLGFAAAANVGIRTSRAPFVVLLNNDATAEPGFVEALIAPFSAPGGERIGATTGRVVLTGRFVPEGSSSSPEQVLRAADGRAWQRVPEGDDGEQLLNSTGAEVTRSGNGRDRDWLAPATNAPAASDVFGFNGGCAALRRTALDDVGLLDPSLFMYYEDTDLSWRLRRRGWRVHHAPEAVSIHLHAASSGTTTPFFLLHNARNRLTVAVIHAPWEVVVRAFVRTAGRAVRGRDRRIVLRALALSICGLPSTLRRRAEVERTSSISRRTVARHLVDD